MSEVMYAVWCERGDVEDKFVYKLYTTKEAAIAAADEGYTNWVKANDKRDSFEEAWNDGIIGVDELEVVQ